MAGFFVRPLKNSHLWAVSAPYFSPKLNSVARQIPGTEWRANIRAHVGYPDAIEQVVKGLRALGLKSDDAPAPDLEYKHNLLVSYDEARDYQRTGIDFCIVTSATGALLADDMGVGKSMQATKAARALRRKTLVVCPAHVRGVWERPKKLDDKGGELAKWWPDAKVFTPYGLKTKTIPNDVQVVVIHYDIVHSWVEEILKWSGGDLTCIFDEAHVLLNPTSRRSKACAGLAHDALGRIALTGTPPTDRIKDLYGIMETISPGRFGDFFPYGKRYCDGKLVEVRVHKGEAQAHVQIETAAQSPGETTKAVWDWSGKSNLPELRERFRWFVLRRTKREVLKELPALTRQIIDVEISSNRRVGMTAQIVGDKRRMRAALDSAADGKLKSVLALCRDHLAEGRKIIVGTYRRAVCERIADALGQDAPTSFIHGGVALPNRSKITEKLRKMDGACCLVANIDAVSTGVDFTFATNVIFAELVWEPRDLAQFEARAHRFNTKEPVLVQYVIARGTGDELILHGVINKMDNFLQLIETDEGDGLRETLANKEEGLSRLAAALKKMGQAEVRAAKKKGRAA